MKILFLSLALTAGLVRRWHLRAPVLVAAACFATPLVFYAVEFWEMTLGVAAVAAMFFLLDRKNDLAAGLVLALGLWFRPEMFFFAVIAVIAAAIIWLIVLALVRHAGSSDPVPGRNPSDVVSGAVQPAEEPVSQEIHLDESELDALIVPETPTISVLKMDKTPGVRDTP